MTGYDPARWKETIGWLEVSLREGAARRVPGEGLRGQTLAVLVSMVRTGVVPDFAVIQEHQHSQPDPAFELAARPLTDFAPSIGAVCLDALTDAPRQYGLDVVLMPGSLPVTDPSLAVLGDHEQNMALLREVGVWHTAPPNPSR